MFVAVLANISMAYLEKRRMQGAADLAALELISSGEVTPERVRTLLLAQGFDLEGVSIAVTTGNYSTTRASTGYARYQANTSPANAVRVDVAVPVREHVASGWLRNDNRMDISAVARVEATAELAMGSRLLRLEGGLSGEILSAALGYEGAIKAMDYEQLLDVQVSLLDFLDALDTDLDLQAVTYQEVLDSEVTLGAVAAALQVARTDGLALPGFAVAPELAGRPLTLGDLIHHDGLAYAPAHSPHGPEPIVVDGGRLLFASAALADGDRQISLEIEGASGLATLELRIGEVAQLMSWNLSGEKEDALQTAQTRLRLAALEDTALLGGLGIEVNLASATAEIADVVCSARTVQRVDVEVTTSPSSLALELGLLGRLSLDLSDSEVQTVSFSPDEIAARTVKQARSGLGVNVNDAPLLARGITRAVDTLLVDLGLHLGEADLWVTGASCNRPVLVL
ncbi:MAG: pilus assembly protein TadG-related protein [Hyphomonadaceae bacterium]|nr:pilus assembly protein TadG-related protein [Hyphomonadaceae bacterium]